MIRIKLFEENGKMFPDVPQWWMNFATSFEGESVEEVNHALLDYSASFWIANTTIPNIPGGYGDRYLDFYDDHACSWFILRWS